MLYINILFWPKYCKRYFRTAKITCDCDLGYVRSEAA